jgi:hypothetical protein
VFVEIFISRQAVKAVKAADEAGKVIGLATRQAVRTAIASHQEV